MDRLRVLITNNALADRAGSELYVRDVALALLGRGHSPVAYSTTLGDVARELRLATVPVVNDLDLLAEPPDIIHGHHHLDTMTALLRFPGVPAVSFCHGWLPWEEMPPVFPRILRYVAVDHVCRERLVSEHGIGADRVRLLLNFVDLRRFKPRGPLPSRPRRALVFSNHASEHAHVAPIREACARLGLKIDVMGASANRVCARPEEVLGGYDIVFARARAALEALAVGAAVVLCDAFGAGPLVTTENLERLRPLNFGIRTLSEPVTADAVARELARYDPADAAEVSRRIRATAGLDRAVEELISLYHLVITEHESSARRDSPAELRAASAYLRMLAPVLKERDRAARSLRDQLAEKEREIQRLSERLSARAFLKRITGSLTRRMHRYLAPTKEGGRVADATRAARPERDAPATFARGTSRKSGGRG